MRHRLPLLALAAALIGLSKVRYHALVLGTVLGSIPNPALVTYFGETAFVWFGTAPA